MKFFKHELYQWFERHLYSTFIEEMSEDEFVAHVAGDYVQHLTDQGRVALNQIDPILEEVEDEVRNMLRIKTYGFFSIQEFRDSQPDNKKRRGVC